jgi:hypothetical protein
MSKALMIIIGAAVVLVGAAVGLIGLTPFVDPATKATSGTAVWSEARWPFPIDQWGTGRAFACKSADCGSEVTLFLRAKLGFCNCTTGVADDEELERVGDLELVGTQSAAVAPGRPITVHWMKGRSRGYAIAGGASSARSAVAIAINDRCDAIVATAVVGNERALAQEAAVLEFLNSGLVRRWAETALGI